MILFIGNSYTGVNNLPQLVQDVAASAGDTFSFFAHNPGGQTLMNHSSEGGLARTEIAKGIYNCVVLQEQSQIPSFTDNEVSQLYAPYVRLLDSAIKAANPCARTLLYMTWGRKNGDASNCQTWPPVCTYMGMDSLLRLRTLNASKANTCDVAPVGVAWRLTRERHPEIELYQPDESHPSLEGSYLAACVFYTAIFGKDPLNIAYNAGLDPAVADTLRHMARTSVYQQMDQFQVNYSSPKALFKSNSSAPYTRIFSNQSHNADSFVWYFGDGDTSHLIHPEHKYSQTGKYEVVLEAFKCGQRDTLSERVAIENTGLSYPLHLVHPAYPNPLIGNSFQLGISGVDQIIIADREGKLIKCSWENCDHETTITLIDETHSGLYYGVLISKDQTFHFNFVKLSD